MSASSLKVILHCPIYKGFKGEFAATAGIFERISLRDEFETRLKVAPGIQIQHHAVAMGPDGRAQESMTLSSEAGREWLASQATTAFTHTLLNHRGLVLRKGEETRNLTSEAQLQIS